MPSKQIGRGTIAARFSGSRHATLRAQFRELTGGYGLPWSDGIASGEITQRGFADLMDKIAALLLNFGDDAWATDTFSAEWIGTEKSSYEPSTELRAKLKPGARRGRPPARTKTS